MRLDALGLGWFRSSGEVRGWDEGDGRGEISRGRVLEVSSIEVIISIVF